MKISIFGLGYVGAVLTGSFARDGHSVIGVDTNPEKVAMVSEGKSPIIERYLDELIYEGVKQGRITATTDHYKAVIDSDISMICVGTPSRPSGDIDLTFVQRVSESIAIALKEKNSYHITVVRSTILPGTSENVIIPVIEKHSGKKFGVDFGVVSNPEFLREGSAVEDFLNPPMTIIGAINDRDFEIVSKLYSHLPAKIIRMSIRAAEMIKYASNAFHALKIVFGNEIGLLCKEFGIDAAEVMEAFCEDRKLNISPAYLRPGFAFGGSCLPKDLRALVRAANSRDVELPLLKAISVSNESLIKNALNLVVNKNCRRIGVLGFAFKEGTDDLRESPIISLIELLIGKGYELKLFDRHVSLARIIGANKKYIQERIPHISRLMVETPDELVAHSEVILIGNDDPEFDNILLKLTPEQSVIDLRPVKKQKINTPAAYERITG